MSHRNSSNHGSHGDHGNHGNHGRAPRPQRHHRPVRSVRFASMKGGAPAERSAGAGAGVDFVNSSGPGWSTANGLCTVPPTVPGWPDAVVKVAAISTSGFWQTATRPCVFRVLPTDDMTPEEFDAIIHGLFLFLVRPGSEDADAQALSDVLEAQGGPVLGKPVDLSGGAGTTIMQVVAVLQEKEAAQG